MHLSFGSGPIISELGAFSINLAGLSKVDTISATFSNPNNVQGYLRLGGSAATIVPPDRNVAGDLLRYLVPLNAITPASTASLNFTGPISVGGQLLLSSGSIIPNGVPAQSTLVELSGTIVLDQTSSHELDVATDASSHSQRTILSGNIVEGALAGRAAASMIR